MFFFIYFVILNEINMKLLILKYAANQIGIA